MKNSSINFFMTIICLCGSVLCIAAAGAELSVCLRLEPIMFLGFFAYIFAAVHYYKKYAALKRSVKAPKHRKARKSPYVLENSFYPGIRRSV